ncbi:uncharacterized protein BDR25DRAFT_356126 [Lindgomyces ingoldianus]|uniref:Uncharacterized protein n=1 Tax=Lindgomyces ingoldianus TaxID=673940 RepID=A0ACB6QSM6_9PLEO|nr:uncharacterized protein BDR25DRAFT_356126 [Lindgomyces ingoldianus]KAF2469875.1 hypothetical protein BDR25DRAFT_356126 [Lindgomyces ingoldianus]
MPLSGFIPHSDPLSCLRPASQALSPSQGSQYTRHTPQGRVACKPAPTPRQPAPPTPRRPARTRKPAPTTPCQRPLPAPASTPRRPPPGALRAHDVFRSTTAYLVLMREEGRLWFVPKAVWVAGLVLVR